MADRKERIYPSSHHNYLWNKLNPRAIAAYLLSYNGLIKKTPEVYKIGSLLIKPVSCCAKMWVFLSEMLMRVHLLESGGLGCTLEIYGKYSPPGRICL